MNFSIVRITVLAIIIPMAAFLFVGYISYENTIQFIQRDAVDDTVNLISQRLEHLVSTITDAEAGQQGYMLTDRLHYLEPYNSAVRDIHTQLGNLDMLMANEPINQQVSKNELNILKSLIEAKLAELKQTITLRQLHILSNTGKTLMDNIRAITADIQSQQNIMLALGTRQSQAYVQDVTYTIIITTLVAAGITGVSIFVINRGLHKRHLAIKRSLQTDVQRRTEQLNISNNQLSSQTNS